MSYKCLAFAGQEDFLSNIVHLSNVGSMLDQRRRRWPNIKTALGQFLVWVVSCNQFSGYINAVNLYSIGYCRPTLDRPRHARFEAEWFFNTLPDKIKVNNIIMYRIKPEELYILSCGKRLGRRPRPFPHLTLWVRATLLSAFILFFHN